MSSTASKNKFFRNWFTNRSFLLRLVDLVVTIFGILGVSILTASNYFNTTNANLLSWLLTYLVYFLLIGEIFELYHKTKNRELLILVRNIFLTTLITMFLYLLTPKITPELPKSRLEIVWLYLGMTVPLLAWRLLYNTVFYKDVFLKNILFIGTAAEIVKTLELINKCSLEYKVGAYMSEKEIVELEKYPFYSFNSIELIDLVNKFKIKTILVSDLFDKAFTVGFSGQLIHMFKKGVAIESFHEFNEKLSKRLSLKRFNESFYNYFTVSNYNKDSVYVGLVKVLDMVIALLGLVLLAVLIPFILLLNVFFNRGPLIYSQMRIGYHGEPFKIYKLRTMHCNAEQGTALWATKNDIRATAFGHFLRKTRIDEMPQFINILKGDMNSIGPRPERPEFVSMLEKELPYYAMRHVIKPGLTGWAQVEYPYANSVKDQEMKLRYDLYYIKERTPLLDFKIILKTINSVLFYKGY